MAIEKLKDCKDYLNSFFSENKIHLQNNYPGITKHRLNQEIKNYLNLQGLSAEEVDDQVIVKNHPLFDYFKKLQQGIPLEYISEEAFFYRSRFKVNSNVLIPRNETELLVEMVVSELRSMNKACKLLDLGTGSGAIALSLASQVNDLDIVLSDISTKALEIARTNAFKLQYTFLANNKIEFVESDRFKNIHQNFDFIISNPPYIKFKADRATVHDQVLKHEPELALFLDDDNYDQWFKDFFVEIKSHLNENGFSLIEGHENHLEKLKELALEVGFREVLIIKDYTNRNRFIKLKK